jgi:hypothetical protein
VVDGEVSVLDVTSSRTQWWWLKLLVSLRQWIDISNLVKVHNKILYDDGGDVG